MVLDVEEFFKEIVKRMSVEERKVLAELFEKFDDESKALLVTAFDHAYTYYLFFKDKPNVMETCKQIIMEHLKGD